MPEGARVSYATQNVDNYLFFALDKYWSWVCGEQFGPATSEDDQYVRGVLVRDDDWGPDDS